MRASAAAPRRCSNPGAMSGAAADGAAGGVVVVVSETGAATGADGIAGGNQAWPGTPARGGATRAGGVPAAPEDQRDTSTRLPAHAAAVAATTRRTTPAIRPPPHVLVAACPPTVEEESVRND